MDVLLFGRIVVYERGGVYQLDAEAIQPAGVGALAAKLEKLKARLAAEGLFDEARKRSLPSAPRHIGVVTSDTGAAVRDVLVTLARRGFGITVTLAPTRVQGEGAAEEVARAIARLEGLPDPPDLLLVVRGGGSLEDLWAFNEEVAVRAVAGSSIPVISGVGHESDWTLVDLAADLRAPTPTGAAERATPDRLDLRQRVETMGHRLGRAGRVYIEGLRQRVEAAGGAYGLRRIPDQLAQHAQRLDTLQGSAERALAHRLERTGDRLGRHGERLQALSPLAVLGRGYAVATSNGRVVRDAAELMEGELLQLRLARGEADARVEEVRPRKQ
jgi:exodeoxyribonuclease VII large subunit